MPKKDITAHQRTRRWHDGLAAINAATAANKVPGVLATHGKKLDLDMAGYNGLRSTSAVDAALFTIIGADGFDDQKLLASVFDPAVALRASIEAAIDKVNISETADILGDVLVDNALLLTLDLDDYNLLSEANQESVHDTVFAGLPYDDETKVKTAFDAAVAPLFEAQAIAAVNAATAETMGATITTYAAALGLDLTDYAALEEAKKGVVHTAMVTGQPYADKAAIKTAFDAAVLAAQAIAAVNAATAETMGATITTYAAALGLDLTDYAALEEAKKGVVHTAMVTGQPYADKAAIKTAFDAAVLAAQGE